VNVELNIEELVLYGFPPGDQHGIGDAARHELSRLFAERGVPPSLTRGGDAPRLDAGSFEMSPGQTTETTIGARVARSVYEALSPGQEVYGRKANDGRTG
jgi:hypothetical protein